MLRAIISLILLTILSMAFSSGLKAQQAEFPSEISITIEEAVQLALVNNHLLRKGVLDIEQANAQIREAYAAVYPQVGVSASYTRNIRTPNPFAGSDAGGFFQAFGAIEWLAFNERARTDGDPTTSPIDFDEFLERQRQGYEDAGLTPPGFDDDNPFGVENQANVGVGITQAIYNGAAFAAIRGARQLRQINVDQLEIDRQQVVDNIQTSFYGALLAQEQKRVLRESVSRLDRTVEETRRAVDAGVLSKFDRVSAEVELVNLETNLISAENQAQLAVKNLALQLGIPVQTDLTLLGELEMDESRMVDLLNAEQAYELALQQRLDLNQANDFIDLLNVQRGITRSGYFPVVNAFLNAAYVGQIPDNRVSVMQVPGQDFTFTSSSRGFFDDAYWSPSVAVGIQLNWNIFDGLRTSSQMQQNRLEIKQAKIDRELIENALYLEIDEAVRRLENAYRRIMSQERNLEQAELNYEFALTRLREGIGTPLEERQASALLDQSKLNYLSAVHDYLTALSNYDRAIGKPILN